MKLSQIKSLDPKRVIVLDTETTGLHPDGDEILSLTIIELEGTVIFEELVKPERRKRWPKSEEVHGITPAMVRDKQPLSAYREQLEGLWKRIDLVVGYNIEFDSDFLYSSSLNLSPYVEEFDVMKEFAPVWGKLDSYHNDFRWAKLIDCAKYYGIGGFEAHSSLGDTGATRQCFLKLIDDPDYARIRRSTEGIGATAAKVTGMQGPEPNTKRRQDKLDIALLVFAAMCVISAVINLFKEWQMSVSQIFLCAFVLLIKAIHDARRDRKEG